VTDAAQLLQQAKTYHQAGQLQDAEQFYRQALATDGSNAEVLYLLGAVSHQLGKPNEAIAFLQQAVRLQPAAPDPRHHLGVVLSEVDRLDEAVAHLQEAWRLRPHSAEISRNLRNTLAAHHNKRGNALEEQNRLAEAMGCYQDALAVEPNFIPARGNLGNVLKLQGRFEEAEVCYKRVLELAPNSAQAHNDLGLIAIARDDTEGAIRHFRRSLELDPQFPSAHTNLGVCYSRIGELEQAAAHCTRALELNPNFDEAHNDLGSVLIRQEKLEEAVSHLREAVRLNPRYFDAYHNLGVALSLQNKLGEAEVVLQQGVELAPNYTDMRSQLALIQKRLGKNEQAEANYRRAVELAPNHLSALNGLGAVLAEKKKYDEAMSYYRRALDLKPDYADVHNNVGAVLSEQDRVDEAIESYHRVLKLNPECQPAYYNLADALVKKNDLPAAIEACRKSIELAPEDPESHGLLGLLLLKSGEFAEGWEEYEWRFKAKDFEDQAPDKPRWDGSSLEGRTILLRGEQGLGDTIQFIRYAKLVKKRGGTVIVECPRQVLQLIATAEGVDKVIAKGDPRPDFDVHAPLLSLPAIFETTLKNVPNKVPYLKPDKELLAKWKDELSKGKGLKVGIAWQGNPTYRKDHLRSVPLTFFQDIVNMSGARFYSLQFGQGREQLANLKDPERVVDLGDRLGEFHETAAIVANLDLVISSDNGNVHLAGALGVPVWMATSFAPDWRWLLERPDSPWYPTMRLFRQPAVRDWDTVFRNIKEALKQKVEESS
jgi:tetratricopeptide (TPR) repeat protein